MPPPRLPGPVLSRLTALPLRLSQVLLRRGLGPSHARHGPIVQIAPRRVSVNTTAGLRDVFLALRARRMDRESPLPFLHNYGQENLVSTVDGDVHAARRAVLRGVYSKTVAGAPAQEVVVDRAVRGFLDLAEEGAGEGVDVKELLRLALVDVMSPVVYGAGNATNVLGDEGQRALLGRDVAFDEWQLKWSPAAVAALLLPDLTMRLLKWGWDPKGLDKGFKARPFTDGLGRRALEGLRNGTDAAEGSVMARLYAEYVARGPGTAVPSVEYILSDCVDHLWAGISTTLDALTPLFKHLSENEGVQRRLRDEIRDAAPTPESLERLPVLDAVIRETLRLHPPIPFALERKVTAREAPLHVCGHALPEGWVVGAAPEACHMREDVFTHPERWDPERWLDRVAARDMKRHFLAFGAGSRMCIGVNVAWVAMRGIVAGVYGRAETSMVDGKTVIRRLDGAERHRH